MIHFKISITTEKGPGHLEAKAKTPDLMEAIIASFKKVCDEQYEDYKITEIKILGEEEDEDEYT